MNSNSFIKGLFIGLLFIGTVSLGQFIGPAGAPTIPGTNSMAALNATSTNQEKVSGDIGANYFTATNSFCMGGNCINDWWPYFANPSSCKIHTKQISNNTTNLAVYSTRCEDMLSINARNEGWVSTGFDYCTSLSGGNCNGQATCAYMKLTCTGSVTTTPPVSTLYSGATFPFTTGLDPYTYFMHIPQCFDGLNNDGAAGIDYPADPQCRNYADNDEAVL